MTWAEFKTMVESAGVRDDEQVEYIDTTDGTGAGFPQKEHLVVYRYATGTGDGFVDRSFGVLNEVGTK